MMVAFPFSPRASTLRPKIATERTPRAVQMFIGIQRVHKLPNVLAVLGLVREEINVPGPIDGNIFVDAPAAA